MTGLDEVEGSLSARKMWEFFEYCKKEGGSLVDRPKNLEKRNIVLHDLLKIARISKSESDETLRLLKDF